MHVGIQLVAPDGFGQMEKDLRYCFLRNDAARKRVLLVRFEGDDGTQPSAQLIALSHQQFDDAMVLGLIAIAESQVLLPPWLTDLDGLDLSKLDFPRANPKKSHASRVEERLMVIAPLLKEMESILGAEDPVREINRYARSMRPKQNETRVRVWFFTYLCFGRNIWSLLPPFHRSGHWNRLTHGRKMGRPSIARGANYGYRADEEMIEAMIAGFLKFSGLGVTLRHVYDKTMIHLFKCKATADQHGSMRFSQPEGKPFPQYRQFQYRIHKEFGLESVQKTIYGETRHRTRLAASKGNFSAAVANLLERVEADAYYTDEKPRGYREGSSLSALCVVRVRDVLSGLLLGIGFAFGAEKHTAYRMAYFCAAVPKHYFGRLFGVSIENAEWPSIGLPGHCITDRGPGAKRNLIEDFERRFPISEITPSWSGQSKATIESSNPKSIKPEGQPSFFQSDLTPVELARREIYRLLKYNHTANMSGRFQPDPDMAFVMPTPIGLWRHYDGRLRTNAQPMSIPDAVRTFLSPTEFAVKNDGVWFNEQRYDSDELRKFGLLDRVTREGTAKIQGYLLDLCVRYIWVELDGQLLELEAQMRIRDDDEKLFMSLAEMVQWTETRRQINSEFREHQHAAAAHFISRFEDETGKAWDAGKRRPGKPTRDAISRQEEADAKRYTSRGGAR